MLSGRAEIARQQAERKSLVNQRKLLEVIVVAVVVSLLLLLIDPLLLLVLVVVLKGSAIRRNVVAASERGRQLKSLSSIRIDAFAAVLSLLLLLQSTLVPLLKMVVLLVMLLLIKSLLLLLLSDRFQIRNMKIMMNRLVGTTRRSIVLCCRSATRKNRSSERIGVPPLLRTASSRLY